MQKRAFVLAALGGLCFTSAAYAVPQSFACRPGGRSHGLVLSPGPICVLTQDPWQDCGEDP
jgi:hypothetical protein